MTYPKREPYFAFRFVRKLTKTAAAQDLGPSVCWLLSVVAMQEDAKRYTEPAKWYLDQLAPICGFQSKRTLVAAITKAVQAGWLVYVAGTKSRAGRFHVQVPPDYEDLPDGPCDESRANFDTHLEDSGQILPSMRNECGMNAELIQCASNPTPNPSPIIADSAKSAESVPSKRKTKTKPIVGFAEWYEIYPRKVAGGDASNAYSKAIGAIAKADSVSTEQAVAMLLKWTQERLPELIAKETQFQSYPATWLNKGRYRDEITSRTNADAATVPRKTKTVYERSPRA